MPGAVEGVTTLAKRGDVQYITIRISKDAAINEQIQAATRQWLRKNNFPNPDNVTFCASFQEKLQLLAEQSLSPVILIDDRCSSDLLVCYQKLIQNPAYRELVHLICERITFVAFGKKELPEDTLGLRLVAFPSWECSAIPLLCI